MMLGYILAYVLGQSDGKTSYQQDLSKKDEKFETINRRNLKKKRKKENKLFRTSRIIKEESDVELSYLVKNLILFILVIGSFGVVSSFFSVDMSSLQEMVRIFR